MTKTAKTKPAATKKLATRKPAALNSAALAGALTFDDYAWRGRLVGPTKRKLEVTIDAEDKSVPPATVALDALEEWSGRPGGIGAAIGQALWDYYRQVVVRNYRSQLDPKDAALLTPHLDRPEQVWQLVSDLRVAMSISPRGKKLNVMLVGNCDWDDEHGFEMNFADARYHAAK